MARVTTISVAFFFFATVVSLVLLLSGRTVAEAEYASYLSITAAGHAPPPAAARRYAE